MKHNNQLKTSFFALVTLQIASSCNDPNLLERASMPQHQSPSPSVQPSDPEVCFPELALCKNETLRLDFLRESLKTCQNDSECIDPPTYFDYYFEYSCLQNESQLINKNGNITEYLNEYSYFLTLPCAFAEVCPILDANNLEYRCIEGKCH